MGSALGGFLAQKFAEYTRPCPRVASLILCNTFTDTSIFRFTESAPMWVTRLLEICLVTPSEIVMTCCHLFSIRNNFSTYEMQLCIKSFEWLSIVLYFICKPKNNAQFLDSFSLNFLQVLVDARHRSSKHHHGRVGDWPHGPFDRTVRRLHGGKVVVTWQSKLFQSLFWNIILKDVNLLINLNISCFFVNQFDYYKII